MSRDDRLVERRRIESVLMNLISSGIPADRAALRERVDGDPAIWESAVQSLVARGLVPECLGQGWQARHVRSIEQQVLEFAAVRPVINVGSMLRDIRTEHPEFIARVIEELIKRGALVGTVDKCFRPITDDLARELAGVLPSGAFDASFISALPQVADFASARDETADAMAALLCRALLDRGELVALNDGRYCARKYLILAERQVRKQFQEYRAYVPQEIWRPTGTDPILFAFALQRLIDIGQLKRVEGQLRPTPTLPSPGWPCTACGAKTCRIDAFEDVPLCPGCLRSPKRACITKTRAIREFRLKPHELGRLVCLERRNPHYRLAPPMQLYRLEQVRELSRIKWGSPEPYIVALTEFTDQQKLWLLEDPNRFRQLTPERFQYFLADRFDAMGLCVQLVGNVYRSDAGIDLIAYPDPERCAFPFLVAIQAAHHRMDRKSGVGKVRDFVGAYSGDGQPFRIGVIATNTAFTWDAREYARAREHILRLRDLEDLIRWLKNDFVNESEWRELPEVIQFGRYQVPLLKPKAPVRRGNSGRSD